MVLLTIDKTVTNPMYQQIIDQITNMIDNKELKHMELLPSEFQFQQIYDVSSFVVKRAYKALEKKRLIIRIKGKGTFVSIRRDHQMNAFSLDTVYLPNGEEFDHKLLSKNSIYGDFKVRKALKVDKNTKIFSYKILTQKDMLSVSYSELHLLNNKALGEGNYVNNSKTLEQVLSKSYGGVIEVVTTLNAGNSEKIISELLMILVDAPLIVTDTVFFFNKQPIAHLMTIYPGEHTVIETMVL